jgi:hypothetical protein
LPALPAKIATPELLVDGSFFISLDAVSLALTILANALRSGDPLLARLH